MTRIKGGITQAQTTKLAGIETGADVTGAINVDIAGAVMEPDIPNQSFGNLLENYDFESWSAGAAAAPDGWTCPVGSVARGTDKKLGTYALKLTRSGTNAYMHLGVADGANYAGRTMTLGCWVKTPVASQSHIRLKDSAGENISSDHPGDNTYRWLTVTRTIDAGATHLYVRLDVNITDGDTLFDGATLVEGLVCPASTPKPLVDDGVMLHVKTPSAANAAGVQGQICTDAAYIYVCTATNTWERAAIASW